MRLSVLPFIVLFLTVGVFAAPDYQYEYGEILIPAAASDEARLKTLSPSKAIEYLEKAGAAWIGEERCVACHTTGTLMAIRPSLTPSFGMPSEDLRAYMVDRLREYEATDIEDQRRGVGPPQVIYTAAGLAEWDEQISGTLSQETIAAFDLMFKLQLDNGAWGNSDCWPPYESDSFHVATVAWSALASAPHYLEAVPNATAERGVAKLKEYLKTAEPPNDYSRSLLLWAASAAPGLIRGEEKQRLVELLFSRQQEDGGWSIRGFSEPEEWGRGNRAEKLRAEPEFGNPPSDGHQTGLALLALLEAGVPKSDPRIERGVEWLLSNQRESGRWWTRSLNTDKWHYITYSGTALPLLALQRADALLGGSR